MGPNNPYNIIFAPGIFTTLIGFACSFGARYTQLALAKLTSLTCLAWFAYGLLPH